MSNKKFFWILLLGSLCLHQATQAQIVNIEDRRIRLADSVSFGGFADLGLNLYKNNNSVVTAHAAVQMEYLHKKHFILSISQYNFIKSAGNNVLNEGFQHIRYDYGLNDRYVYEAYGQIQYNEQIPLQSRNLVGTGIRVKILKKLTHRIVVGASYMFETERFKDSVSLRVNHRMSSYLAFSIGLPHGSKFSSITYFQPMLADWSNHRLTSNTTLSLNMTKKLAFTAAFNISYDNDHTLQNIPPVTYSLTNGLRWSF